MTEDINILTFDNFIQKIKTIKTYRSNANKEYKVVKVNKTALVLRDQRTKADFEVPAAQVFAAMKELGIENCTVLEMRQYVGTHAAPASAALIFWAFGRGQVQAAIKKFADLTVGIIREQHKLLYPQDVSRHPLPGCSRSPCLHKAVQYLPHSPDSRGPSFRREYCSRR